MIHLVDDNNDAYYSDSEIVPGQSAKNNKSLISIKNYVSDTRCSRGRRIQQIPYKKHNKLYKF